MISRKYEKSNGRPGSIVCPSDIGSPLAILRSCGWMKRDSNGTGGERQLEGEENENERGRNKLTQGLTPSAAILDFMEPEIAPFDPPTPKTLVYNQTWSGSDAPFAR